MYLNGTVPISEERTTLKPLGSQTQACLSIVTVEVNAGILYCHVFLHRQIFEPREVGSLQENFSPV